MLCLLQQGEVGVFSRHNEGKRMLYAMGGNSTPGFTSLLTRRTYMGRFITTKDSVISAFPAQGPFPKLILGKLNVGVMAMRSLAQEIVLTQQLINRYVSYLTGILIANDNLSVAYYRCNPQVFENQQASAGDVIDPVLTAAKVVVSEFKQNGGQIPEPISAAWLQSDQSNIIKKNYEFESQFDVGEFNFLRRILALPTQIQGAMFKADIQILEGLCRRFARILDQNVNELYQLQESVDVGLESLFQGDYCFAEKFHLLSDLLDSGFTQVPIHEFAEILKFIISSAETFLKNYQMLQGIPYKGVTPSLQKLQTFLKSNQTVKEAEEKKAKVESVGADMEAIRKDLNGSAGKIMSFLKLAPEDAKAMASHLKKFKEMKTPMDSGGDPRKVRRAISTIYWKAYEKAYYAYREASGNVPQAVKLMLLYGFFDEELLEDEHLSYLYTLEDGTRANKYPIYSSLAWLDLIRDKKETPSVDEMGLSFFDKLKHEYKDRGWKRESDVPDDINTAERRVHYEIQSMMEVNVRLTSGSPTTAFPILTSHQIILPLDRAFVTQERLSECIDEVLSLDFSAFHREVILNDEERGILKEFVQMQVIPNFILVPSIGTKVMMWQDVAGRSKSSRGRITVPVFATADLHTLLLEAVAAFRWELTKTIMGADWNNVSQSSITADYTDYVQFYKKNRDLSPEIKEKLSAEFKRFRNDRDRFTNDYINWMKYESQGVLKLNKVARNIFYKHVPFSKDVRDNLAAQPAYSEIHNRFKNIRNRKMKELEVRYRKYGEELPEELRNNMRFYGV